MSTWSRAPCTARTKEEATDEYEQTPVHSAMLGLPEQQAKHAYQTRAATDVSLADDDDDRLYETRRPSSVRRYRNTTTTDVPVIQRPLALVVHDGRRQQRSRPASASVCQPASSPAAVRGSCPFSAHPLLFFGVGMVSMLLVWIIGSTLIGWWHTQQDAQHYGMPRTYQTDVRVGHGDAEIPSHFIALNLHGRVVITEFPGGDVTREVTYVGPTLFGPGE